MSRIPIPPDYFSNRSTAVDRKRQLLDTSKLDIQRLKAMATSLIDHKTLILNNYKPERELFEPSKGQFAVFEDRYSYAKPRMFSDMRIQDGISDSGLPIIPAGTLQYFAYTERKTGELVDPDGWLECNGQRKMAFIGTDPATRLSTKYTKLYEILSSWGVSLIKNNVKASGEAGENLPTGLEFSIPEVRGYFVRCYNPDNTGPGSNRYSPDNTDSTKLTRQNLNIPALQIFNEEVSNVKQHHHEGKNLVRFDGDRINSTNKFGSTDGDLDHDLGNSSRNTYQFKTDVSDDLTPKNESYLYYSNNWTYVPSRLFSQGENLSFYSSSEELWRSDIGSGSVQQWPGGYVGSFSPNGSFAAEASGEYRGNQQLKRYNSYNNRYSAYIKHVHANIETYQYDSRTDGNIDKGPVLNGGPNRDTNYNSYTSYIGYNKVYPNQKNETQSYTYYYAYYTGQQERTILYYVNSQVCVNVPFVGRQCVNVPVPTYQNVRQKRASFHYYTRIYEMFNQTIKETDQGSTGNFTTAYSGGSPTREAGDHSHSFLQVNDYGDGDTRPNNIALKLYIKY